MRALGAAILALSLTGCMTAPKSACPAGKSQLRAVQLFLGAKPPATVSDRELRRFVDTQVAPRFPDGVTVMDGGGQWSGSGDRLMRDSAKVVLIMLPRRGDPYGQMEAVRAAYRAQFRQDSVVVMRPAACV